MNPHPSKYGLRVQHFPGDEKKTVNDVHVTMNFFSVILCKILKEILHLIEVTNGEIKLLTEHVL